MPESCSSNELNGCAGCGPGLVLFGLIASTSQAKDGFCCLDGCDTKRYSTRMSSTNGGHSFYSSVGHAGSQSGSDSSSETVIYTVDEYGVIVYSNTIDSTSEGSANERFFSIGGTLEASGSTTTTCKKLPRESSCKQEPENICNTQGDCDALLPGIWSAECGVPGCYANGSCNNFPPYDPPPPCVTETSCTKSTTTGQYSCILKDEELDFIDKNIINYNSRVVLSSLIEIEEIYGYCESSVSTKIGILENNQPQNCDEDTCEGEGKDGCWGGGGCFSIADNNLDDPEAMSTIAQKLKFKIATLKEGFDKKYKSVSGKLNLYISSEEDIELGRTPCCNDDFSGTVVKSTGYSISAGSTFKNDYFASDAGDFDNSNQSYVGETICPCHTIDSVSFL